MTTPCRRMRSIPACAGEPPSAKNTGMNSTVYPRVCGGTGAVGGAGESPAGLSPRVRGNRGRRGAVIRAGRSIPACAGEPGAGARGGWRRRVYPRVCGGTSSQNGKTAINQGLSPRVRGNHAGGVRLPAVAGSIPACAGEPATPTCPQRGTMVYPRVCGGTCSAKWMKASSGGLSPRVRGNHRGTACSQKRAGSIPACAGEPDSAASENPSATVYPRVCGGTNEGYVGLIPQSGLSPRVRGNLSSRPCSTR